MDEARRHRRACSWPTSNAGGGQTIERTIVFGSPGVARRGAARRGRSGPARARDGRSSARRAGALPAGRGSSPAGDEEARVERDRRRGTAARVGDAAAAADEQRPFRDVGARRHPSADPTFYGDSAVIAYRTPADERERRDAATDGDDERRRRRTAPRCSTTNCYTALTVRRARATERRVGAARVRRAVPARAVSIARARRHSRSAACWRATTACASARSSTLPGAQQYRPGRVRTFAFPETRARVIASSSPARRSTPRR